MIIAYYHLPENQLPDYCVKTKDWMAMLKNLGYKIIDVVTPIGENKMYEETLKFWGKDDLVICGQDNIGTLDMLDHFESCEYQFCANPCLMNPKSLGFEGRKLNMISDRKLHEVDDEREFCEWLLWYRVCAELEKNLQLKMDIVKHPFHHQSLDSGLSNLARPAY